MTVMDGPIHLTECAEDAAHECQMSKACAMHGRWNKVNRVIRTALEQVSIYDMALDAPLPPRVLAKQAALRE